MIGRRIGGTQDRGMDYHLMDKDRPFENSNIEIKFMGGSIKDMRDIRNKVGKPDTVLSFRSPYRYNSIVKIEEIVRQLGLVRRTTLARSFRDWVRDNIQA